MRTKENMLQHEFIGLEVEVVASTDRNLIGTKGKIVDETKNMFKVEINGKEKQVQKTGSVFRFEINSENIDVEGERLMFRPEDRIKKCDRRFKRELKAGRDK